MIKVFYNEELFNPENREHLTTLMFGTEEEKKKLVNETFDKVYTEAGQLNTNELEAAFYMTQNTYDSWAFGRNVIKHSKRVKHMRSSCIGDVFVTEDGVKHLATDFGFITI